MIFNPHNYEAQDHRYSQFGEDGVIAGLVRLLDPPRTFFEIGCGDGSENNTRALAEQMWGGVWIDGSHANIKKARELRCASWLRVYCEMIDLENVAYYKAKVPQEIGLLSIDIDGNDWHVWKALCAGAYGMKPWIVVIECQIQKPHDQPHVMPYDPKYVWDHRSHECGASVFSMKALGANLGYTSVGMLSNKHAPNAFFVRNDLLEKLG